ncbi:SHOCT domain-containing protein [Halarchaeum sp. P4]|uniref:SHOCT domain-containing protein n=1 Tax=Halarchaeum sp. P4 TaxID=3421639 RepID=UPI003EBE2F23
MSSEPRRSGDRDLFRLVILVVGVIVLAPLLMMVFMMPMMGMMGWWWSDGMMGGMSSFWGLVMMLFWLVILAGIGYVLYRAVAGSDRAAGRVDPALEELRLAYARGELTQEEFEERREQLRREG